MEYFHFDNRTRYPEYFRRNMDCIDNDNDDDDDNGDGLSFIVVIFNPYLMHHMKLLILSAAALRLNAYIKQKPYVNPFQTLCYTLHIDSWAEQNVKHNDTFP